MPFCQIPPPARMNVKDGVSTNWKMFKEAWCYFVTATELNKKPKEVQAGASFVAQNIYIIEPNVLRLVKPVINVVNKGTLS